MITIDEVLTNGHGTWRSFSCPDHDDANPSARVNAVSGRWVCMVCGSKGAAETYDPPEKLVIAKIRNLDKTHEQLSESYLDLYDMQGPGQYWLSRFSTSACKEFRLGVDGDTPVYPVRYPDGSLAGIVRRGTGKPKYRYPKGLVTSGMLFGYERIQPRTPLVVVEGAPDVIALWEAGIPAVGTFGSMLYPAQQRLLSRLEPPGVVMAYDWDAAGRKGAARASESLGEIGLLSCRAIWKGYNDVADMPVETRSMIINNFLAKYLTAA